MSLQVVPTTSRPSRDVERPGRVLNEQDGADLGHVLIELLFQLHLSGELRPRLAERGPVPSLEVQLTVPGTGEILARLRRTDGCYDLSISGGGLTDTVLLQQASGPLGDLFEQYLSLHAEQERLATQRLVRGLRQLMVVNDWGVRHHQY